MIDPKELERLSKAATPKPWRHDTYGNIYQEDKLVAECDGTELDSTDVHDAELIVYLRNNVEDILQCIGIVELARLNYKIKGQWPADVP